MSDYSQITDFSDKDALTTGDPEKVISGADVDGELAAISTAIASKIDEPGSPSTNDFLKWNGSAWVAAAADAPSSVVAENVDLTAGSPTSINITTSVPSWARDIRVSFKDFSTNGNDLPVFQIGTGGSPTTTGYNGGSGSLGTSTSVSIPTVGFGCGAAASWGSGRLMSGFLDLSIADSSTNLWVATVVMGDDLSGIINFAGGYLALSGALDTITVTTTGGTNTVDSGRATVIARR